MKPNIWIFWVVVNLIQIIIAQVQFPDHSGLLLEILFVTGISAPIFIFRMKETNFPAMTERRFLSGFVAFILLINFNGVRYSSIQFGAGYLDVVVLFLLVWSSFSTGFWFEKNSWIDHIISLITLVMVLLTGRREWLFFQISAFLCGFLFSEGKQRIGGVALLVLAFFLMAPVAVVIRTAAEGKYAVSFSDYSKNIFKLPVRFSQSKITGNIVMTKADSVGFTGVKQFVSTQTGMLLPRFLNPEKLEFRPGQVIYETFISSSNPRRYSYPCSPAAEWFWITGNQAFVIVPVWAAAWSFLVYFMSSRLPFGLRESYQLLALNTEVHLLFWLTAQIRWIVLAVLLGMLAIVIRKNPWTKKYFS